MNDDYTLHTYNGTMEDLQRDPGFEFVRNQTAASLEKAVLAHQLARASRQGEDYADRRHIASILGLRATMLHWKKWALTFMFLFGCALTVIVVLVGLLVFHP